MFENREILDKIANIVAKNIDCKYHIEFMNLSENAMYMIVDDITPIYTIRISRPEYRTLSQLSSEIDWLNLLIKDNLPVPEPVKINNKFINIIEGYYILVFKYIEGNLPEYNDTNIMYQCGKLAAILHNSHKPLNADRPIWNIENMVGKNGLWGDWRTNKKLAKNDIDLITNIIEETRTKIENYTSQNYGLIHIDLRMTNIIIGDKYYAIDFDDCGYGYYIQDLASALSFMEDSKNIDTLKKYWYKGYEEIRQLTNEDKEIADCFIILRRIQLLAWITSHKDSDYVKSVENGFVEATIKYLKNKKADF